MWTVGQTSRDGDLIGTLVDNDPEGSDSDDEGADGGDAEVVPLLALYELLLAAGYDPDTNNPDVIEALSESIAVAIAPDTWRDEESLTDDDYAVAAIAEVWQKSGYIRIDGQARPGYRLRLVVSSSRAGGATAPTGAARCTLCAPVRQRCWQHADTPLPPALLLLPNAWHGSCVTRRAFVKT